VPKKIKFNQAEELEVMPKGKSLAKKYRFSQEELKVVPKRKCLNKIYRFHQKELRIVPK
jgi:hypothetical protein